MPEIVTRLEMLNDLVDQMVSANREHYSDLDTQSARVACQIHDLAGLEPPLDLTELHALVAVAVDRLAHK